jgi:aryl-alcohol dehydrogenase-like predicted oxidoreductase
MDGLDWLKDKNFTEGKIQKAIALTKLSAEIGLSLPVLSLAWCLKNNNVSTVILGASKTSQLSENLKAISAQELLTTDVMERIELIMENKPRKPDY